MDIPYPLCATCASHPHSEKREPPVLCIDWLLGRYWPLRYTASYCSLSRHDANDCLVPLSPTMHFIFSPPHCSSSPYFNSLSMMMVNSIKSPTKVKVNNINCLPLVYQVNHVIAEVFSTWWSHANCSLWLFCPSCAWKQFQGLSAPSSLNTGVIKVRLINL